MVGIRIPVFRLSGRSRQMSAAAVSVSLHFVLLLGLAYLTHAPRRAPAAIRIETRLDRERDMPEFNRLADEVVPPSEALSFFGTASRVRGDAGGGSASVAGLGSGRGGIIPNGVVDQRLIPEAKVAVRPGMGDLPGRTNLDLSVNVKGDPLAEASDLGQAMDQLTREILLMLRERQVLVVWLFDESNSMKDEQAEIRDRFERVYDELGLSGQVQGDTLLTAVASYGEKTHFITDKPTSDRDKIRSAIAAVPTDPSGKENVSTAVQEIVARYSRFWTQGRRRVAIVILTDESGDDGGHIEEAVAAVQKIRSPVYVLGRQSIFGYPFARLIWRDPYGRVFYPLMHRGPESPDIECLQYNGFYERWDEHSSGFGPYELVRLARDSGGIYFILPSDELYIKEQRYDLNSMREYVPEYVSRVEYFKRRESSPLRSSLHSIIRGTENFRLASRFTGIRFSMRRDQFDPAASKSLETVRQYRTALENAYLNLERLQAQRDREPSQRWRAQYDLIRAQVLSYTVKMVDYESILTHLLAEHPPPKGPADPKLPRNNHWAIDPGKKQFTDAKIIGERTDRARSLLEEVISRHPGTPWEHFARWEMNRGFGMELHEYYVNPNPPPSPPSTIPPKVEVPNF